MSEKIKAMFEKFEDEYLKRDFIRKEFLPRDLHAFGILNTLVPGKRDMVSAAEHDEIWLAVSPEELEAANITEEQVITLVQCGVHYDSSIDCLAMFV